MCSCVCVCVIPGAAVVYVCVLLFIVGDWWSVCVIVYVCVVVVGGGGVVWVCRCGVIVRGGEKV